MALKWQGTLQLPPLPERKVTVGGNVVYQVAFVGAACRAAVHAADVPGYDLVLTDLHAPFDRILVTPSLVEPQPGKPGFVFKSFAVRKDLVIRGEQDKDHMDVFWKIPQAERDTSDHYPIVAEFELKR